MPEDYDPALKKWTVATLPIVPDAVRYKPIAKTAGRLEIVRKCFKSRGNGPFLLATDAEREGEIIGAVYERDKSIEGFSREKYVEVTATLTGENGAFTVKLVNADDAEFPARFPLGASLPGKVDAAKDAMRSGIVREAERERKTVHPPKLYNLTTLQKDAHKIYSYPPERTLELAQSLYEKHECLSYPRTPSRVMGDGNVGLVKDIFRKLCEAFPNEAEGSDPESISPGNKRLFNSAELRDHHALVPLDIPAGNLSADERNVYMLVLQSFFRVLGPPHVYNSVKIKMDISGFPFAGSGVEVLHDGWKAFSDHETDGDESEGREDFTGIERGKSYPVESVNARERETEPKKRHTFASLLSLMENPRDVDGRHLVGLGTPATRGAILKKLVDCGYLLTKGKSVTLSDDGKFLMENIAGNERLSAFFSVPETTKWEERLHADTAAFLDGIREFVRLIVAHSEVEAYSRQRKSLGKCPLCGGEVYESQKSYHCENYKGGDPCKFAVWKEICGAAVSEADVRALLSGKRRVPKNVKA